VSLVVVGVFATFSWHVIEKPMLRLKRLVLTRADQGRSVSAKSISQKKGIDAAAVVGQGSSIHQCHRPRKDTTGQQ
jgi:peptidoglycan/LPS O-acetylase OafA/YrhL